MDFCKLNGVWENGVLRAMDILQEAGIDYNPALYYYTPITMYPRSISPNGFFGKDEVLPDLTGFKTMFYVHTPYCSTRCTFCPFYLEVSDTVNDEFTEGLVEQVRMVSERMSTQPREFTLYFGGGSSNLLSRKQIAKIVDVISRCQRGNVTEICVEMHPEVTKISDYFGQLLSLGVTRISLGYQSKDPKILRKTARHHSSDVLDTVIKKAGDLGLTVNVDIMYGGFIDENLESDYETFQHAFSTLRPDWVTAYQMCIQEGTAEFQRFFKERDRYPDTRNILSARSLVQAIAASNDYLYCGGDFFSRDAQNNPHYQKNKWGDRTAVIAFGPGTYTQIVDNRNLKGDLFWSLFDIDAYMNSIRGGELPFDRRRVYTSEDVQSWVTISKLKTRCLSNETLSHPMKDNMNTLEQRGFLERTAGEIRLSRLGILIEDLVYASLMPRSIWEDFKERREQNGYMDEATYDWFFCPETVLKFKDALGLS